MKKEEKIKRLRDSTLFSGEKAAADEALKRLRANRDSLKKDYEPPPKNYHKMTVSFKKATRIKPFGDLNLAKYFFCGEQPGKMEVRLGKPFVGPSGKLLDECLLIAGIVRSDCYITNVIKDLDKHLDSYINIKSGRAIVSNEGLEYINLVKEEVKRSNAKVVIAIGNVALYALTEKMGVTKWRGSVLKTDCGKLVIPIIHPATVLPPKNVYTNKLLIQYDLSKARKIAENGYKPKEYVLKTKPSFFESVEALLKIRRRGLSGKIVDFDIEVFNEEVSCISFSIGKGRGISIPFIWTNGDYFSIERETRIWKLIAEILEDIRIKKRGQNLSFDAHFLLRKYGIKTHNMEDTMVAQRTIMPDYPIGLDFITSIWTDHEYYKDEGKKWFKHGGSWKTLWEYNIKDSLMCEEAFPKQWKEIIKQGNEEAYNRQVKMIEPLVYMQERGTKVDIEGIKEASIEMKKEIEKLKEELNQIAGRKLNPNSPKQLKEYFYGKLGHKPYKSRATGSATTDNNAMKRLARKGFKEAKLVQEIRRLIKLSGTYLSLDKFDDDNRLRCSYNPVGTKFSRVSSSANIFGTGMNKQNWPHELLKYLLADDGYIYYSFDLAQAENRIVAYEGEVLPMIEAFENNKDVHRLTAGLIFNKNPDDVTTEDRTCSLGDGTHNERFWGKKANHGLNYDLGYKTFAFYYEILERDAKFIVDRYHYVFPGVRNNFHTMIRKQLAKNRTITNLMGRKTMFLGQWGDKLFKEGYSCIPQGTVGDVINERGVEYIYYNQEEFRPIELLDQVHDSIGFQIPLSTPLKKHAEMLIKIKKSLETPLMTTRGREFIIPADLTIGFSMSKSEGKELKGKDFPDNVEELADKLKEIINDLCEDKRNRKNT